MFRTIVVGTDGSDRAARAVAQAADLAKLCGAKLHIVHAYRGVEAPEDRNDSVGFRVVFVPSPDE